MGRHKILNTKPIEYSQAHIKLWNSLLRGTVNAKSLHRFKMWPKSQKTKSSKSFLMPRSIWGSPWVQVLENQKYRGQNELELLWCFCGPMLQTTAKDHWTVVCQTSELLCFVQWSSYCGHGLRHLLKNLDIGFILLVHGTLQCLSLAFFTSFFLIIWNILVKEKK